MSRRYDHVDLRVRSLAEVRSFYEGLLPALGFHRNDSNSRWLEFEAVEAGVSDYFAVTESPGHVANANRIAFWADTKERVDELAVIVRDAGAQNVEGPAFEAPHYYAVFFEDPCGNRFEICHRTEN